MDRKTLLVVGVVLAAALIGSACSADGRARRAGGDDTSTAPTPVGATGTGCVGPLDGPETHAYAAVDGIDPDRLSLDVYRRPDASDCPVMVWVHGGGWRGGDKQGQAIDTKVAWAGSLGMVLVSVNYRLVGSDDVMWPTFATDVASSVDWVLDHADELGVDPTRLALVGHSAGAHLVSILGTDPALLESAGRSLGDVRCVVSLDTASYDMREKMADSRALVLPAFGDDPDTLADASPTAQVRLRVDTTFPPFLIVERGTAVRRGMADDVADALRNAGTEVTVVDARGYTHADVNRRLGEEDEGTVTPPVAAFLRGCLA